MEEQLADTPELTVTLERALLRELSALWHQINTFYFKDALRPPAIELTASRARLGRWVPDVRTIELSRPLLLTSPWGVVVEVMKHEIAHQYVYEVLRAYDEAAHGPAFRGVCTRLGIDARAAGLPVIDRTQDDATARVVERIARLLALAESPNEHEAQAAAAAAQRLMLKYNLEARAAHLPSDYGVAHLGLPTGRVAEHERILAMLLAKHFFVEVIWVPTYRPQDGKRGSVVEVCGSRANLAMAEYVHAFLLGAAERSWMDHKATLKIRGNRERRTFLAGVMAGFAEKLARQAEGHRDEGLVWVKDGDLATFFKHRHPHVRHVRHSGNRRTEAFARGREAGRKIVLHRAVNGSAADRGRLLTS